MVCGQLLTLLKQDSIQHAWTGSTDGVYRTLHLVIAVFLVLVSIVMLLYGFLHWFPDLPEAVQKISHEFAFGMAGHQSIPNKKALDPPVDVITYSPVGTMLTGSGYHKNSRRVPSPCR